MSLGLPPTTELIETMRLNRQGQVLLLPLHLQRIALSARQLGFTWSQSAALTALAPYLHQRYQQTQRLRLSLAKDGRLTVQCSPLHFTPQPTYVVLAPQPIQAQPLYLRHKTTQRQHWATSELWLQQHPHYFDVVHYDEQGFITEGGRSNIYIYHEQQWWTPPISQDLLAGVQRTALIQQGLVQEKHITVSELISAQHIRVSNALRGWLNAKLKTPTTLF